MLNGYSSACWVTINGAETYHGIGFRENCGVLWACTLSVTYTGKFCTSNKPGQKLQTLTDICVCVYIHANIFMYVHILRNP